MEQVEVLAHHGIKNLLVANEIAGEAKVSRFVDLARRAGILVAVDNAKVVADMARIARNKKTQLNVLIDVNVGLNPCGVEPGEAAVNLAKAAVQEGLVVRGVMGYEGHLQHSSPGAEKESACRAALKLVVNTRNLIEGHGIPCAIVSAGGTGTYSITGRFPGVTEVQAGTFVAMDTSYMEGASDFQPALSVLVTVISKTEGKRVVVDAARKAIGGERGLPAVKGLEGVRLTALHFEHAVIEFLDPTVPLDVGDKLEVWVHYSDPTVQLHERMFGIREGQVEEVLSIGN